MDAATELDSAALGGALSHPAVRALGHVPASIRRRRAVRGWLASDRARDAAVKLLHRTTSERALTRSLALSSLAKARGADVAMRVTGTALELVGLRAGAVRPELEKLWRDAKLTQIYEGTNQLNRLEVYRGLCHGETLHLPAAAAPHRRWEEAKHDRRHRHRARRTARDGSRVRASRTDTPRRGARCGRPGGHRRPAGASSSSSAWTAHC